MHDREQCLGACAEFSGKGPGLIGCPNIMGNLPLKALDHRNILTLGVNNLFDWEPRRLPVQGGFESRLYDNYGRMISISLDVEL